MISPEALGIHRLEQVTLIAMERACSQCGYDLSGIGVRGRCPECGQVFNVVSGEGIRPPQSGARRKLDLAARLRTITLGLGTLCVLICGGVLSIYATTPVRLLVIVGVFGLLGGMMTVTSYLYENE